MSNLPQSRDYRTQANRLGANRIDEALIRAVVHRFYERAQADPLLGPVFEQRVADWPAHLDKMCDFWSSGIMQTGRYHGRPARAHLRIEEIRTEHFDRWLALFRETVNEVGEPDQAAVFIDLAERMGQAMATRLNLDPPSKPNAAAAEGPAPPEKTNDTANE